MSSSVLARIALVCLVCAFGSAWGAAEPAYSPAAVKAAFLHRFASYIEWPDTAASTDAFTIAVTGADEVADQLEQLLPQLKIQNKRAQLRRVEAPEDLAGVRILYIGPTATQRARSLLAAASKLPILTITDDARGLASGSVINFVQVGRNIRFEVSLPAAERSKLRIDSGLLSVAARVEEQPRANAAQKKSYLAYSTDRPPRYRERGRS
ncbi:MAG TPA: YfiR family protein [Steroidobacteraceae bacterium]|nr:YfiR family protein [Steroidobacteraceae bacterium]